MASAGEPEPPRPPRSAGGWITAAAGVGGFLAGGGLCLAACYGLLYCYVSGLPRRAEVSDALADVPVAFCGLGLTLLLSLGAGVASGSWAAARASRLRSGK